jgi:hypothetical protein
VRRAGNFLVLVIHFQLLHRTTHMSVFAIGTASIANWTVKAIPTASVGREYSEGGPCLQIANRLSGHGRVVFGEPIVVLWEATE